MKARMEQFPATNPNPVLSIEKDGTVIYSNAAGEPLLHEWGIKVGEKLPLSIVNLVRKVISRNNSEKIEVKAEDRVYSLAFHPLPEEECVNVYGFDISDRKELEEKLRKSEGQYRQIVTTAQEGIWTVDAEGKITYINEIMADWLGYSVEELIGEYIFEFVLKEDLESAYGYWKRRKDGIKESYDFRLKKKDGSHIWVIANGTPLMDAKGNFVGNLAMFSNIIERKRVEQERETTVEFLHLVNESRSTKDLVHSAVGFFRERSGFEAVGIRLKEGDDYPYLEASGFSEEFIRSENSLCTRDTTGQIVCDSAGYPIHECMCGNIIHGRFDPSKSFFTRRGSFCTNCTTELLATTTDADRQARTRNRCNGEGYESVALIALRVGEECLGLLQLNDKLKGKFSPETITMWERLADYLAVALAKTRAEEALREAYENLQVQSEELQAQSEELQMQSEELQAQSEEIRVQNEELQAQSEEIREANEALLVSEERYRMLFTNMTEGFALTEVVYDKDGRPFDYRYLEINPAFERNLGVKREDLIGKYMLEVFPKTTFKTIEMFREAALTGHSTQYEVFSQEKNTDIDIYAFSPEEGKLAFIFRDISERKQMERELQESEKKYRNIIETASEGIWIGDPEARTTYVNKRMAEMIGYTQEEIIGRFAWDFADEEGKPAAKSNLEKRRQRIDESYEFKFICKDGSHSGQL